MKLISTIYQKSIPLYSNINQFIDNKIKRFCFKEYEIWMNEYNIINYKWFPYEYQELDGSLRRINITEAQKNWWEIIYDLPLVYIKNKSYWICFLRN